MKQVHIEYVAMFREKAGCREERVSTSAATAAELYDEVSRRHEFNVPTTSLRVAMNDTITAWTQTIYDGDRILFLPPSSGG